MLDFELSVTEDDILSHHQSLMSIALGIHRTHSDKAHSRAVDSHHHRLPSHSTRNHRRRTPVPELEPSSPESSSGSSASSYSSPQTPSSTDSSPAHDPIQKLQPPQSRKSMTMDLLRSFPLPIPGATHQSRSWRQSLHL